jgi:hypothetical protein
MMLRGPKRYRRELYFARISGVAVEGMHGLGRAIETMMEQHTDICTTAQNGLTWYGSSTQASGLHANCGASETSR